MDRRDFNLWSVIRPAPDVPGEWLAHVIDLDLVTQGKDPRHAIEMAREAATMVILDDLNRNRDPLARGESVSPEEVDEFEGLLDADDVQELSLDDVDHVKTGCLLVHFRVACARRAPEVANSPMSSRPLRGHASIPMIRAPQADACAAV